jgi:hypothetical protein
MHDWQMLDVAFISWLHKIVGSQKDVSEVQKLHFLWRAEMDCLIVKACELDEQIPFWMHHWPVVEAIFESWLHMIRRLEERCL